MRTAVSRFAAYQQPRSAMAVASAAGSSIQFQARDMSCSTFAVAAKKAQSTFAEQKTKEAQLQGKQLFETETLDDIPDPVAAVSSKTTMTPELATDIVNAATALRIRPVAGTIYTAVMKWALMPEVVEKMPVEALSRLLHSAVILHSPHLFDLLITYLWRVVEAAPTMDAVTCAVIINAYGRGGVKHTKLYKALGDRALQTVSDSSITMAHVANMSYALSRVNYGNKELYTKLKDQCLALRKGASPLIVASILESFATAGIIDDDLFDAYESILAKNLEKCSPPLLASIISTLAKAKREKSEPLFATCRKRVIYVADTFDSASIGRVMEALYISGVSDEDLLAALSERSCKIPSDFRVVEVRQTLEALAHFGLYDPELFPLLGSRIAGILRSRGVFDLDNVASTLAAFATVHERHEDLIVVGTRVLSDAAQSMAPRTYINSLYAFAIHNVRNEGQRKMIEGARPHYAILQQEAARDSKLAPRLEVVTKTYFK